MRILNCKNYASRPFAANTGFIKFIFKMQALHRTVSIQNACFLSGGLVIIKQKAMERKNGNWTIKRTRKVFENDFFKVFEDEVIQPDGKDGTYATICFARGVAVLPIDDDRFVYLTKQFRYALEREDLEVVSGAVEEEEPREAAKREAREELGIEAEDWIDLGKIESDTSITNSTAHLFLARKLTFGEPAREGTEQIETVKMKFDEALDKVMKGEITHGQTVALILKASLSISDLRFRISD
jgi:8-oxo-dGTP pyrophosphatase MutT (NUDIX family)